jgi:hypothetical protein
MNPSTRLIFRRLAFAAVTLALLTSWVIEVSTGLTLPLFAFNAVGIFSLAAIGDYIRIPWINGARVVSATLGCTVVGTLLLGLGLGECAFVVGVFAFMALAVRHTALTYHAELAKAEDEYERNR